MSIASLKKNLNGFAIGGIWMSSSYKGNFGNNQMPIYRRDGWLWEHNLGIRLSLVRLRVLLRLKEKGRERKGYLFELFVIEALRSSWSGL